MKKNTTISILVLIIIILSAYLAKYYFESEMLRQHWGFEEKSRNERQILSMNEIRNYFSKKMSLSAEGIIVEIFDFKNGVYFGAVSLSLNTGKPESKKIGNFFLSKKNGVIFSEETNGEFNCKSLTDKGFDLSTVDSMGTGCYISK